MILCGKELGKSCEGLFIKLSRYLISGFESEGHRTEILKTLVVCKVSKGRCVRTDVPLVRTTLHTTLIHTYVLYNSTVNVVAIPRVWAYGNNTACLQVRSVFIRVYKSTNGLIHLCYKTSNCIRGVILQ